MIRDGAVRYIQYVCFVLYGVLCFVSFCIVFFFVFFFSCELFFVHALYEQSANRSCVIFFFFFFFFFFTPRKYAPVILFLHRFPPILTLRTLACVLALQRARALRVDPSTGFCSSSLGGLQASSVTHRGRMLAIEVCQQRVKNAPWARCCVEGWTAHFRLSIGDSCGRVLFPIVVVRSCGVHCSVTPSKDIQYPVLLCTDKPVVFQGIPLPLSDT